MTKYEYQRYLSTPHWKALRRKKHHLQHYCQCCGSREALDIHHKTYVRLGNERLSDLQVLCRECHYLWHERQKGIGHIRPSYIIHRIVHFIQKSYAIESREKD